MKVAACILLLTVLLPFQSKAQCHERSRAVKASYSWGHDDLVDIAVSTPDFSTLVTALKKADLVSALKGDGPFTVFAPDNSAFNKLPEGTIPTLLQADNKATLVNILTYHVVSGAYSAETLLKAVNDNGSFKISALNGGILTAKMKGNDLVLMDEKSGISIIKTTDVEASNGVIHVIDDVVMPKK